MSTDPKEPVWDRELVMVTGKGGVGKTTVAAALARAAHSAGRKVLIAEVASDTATRSAVLAHFGLPIVKSEEPVELKPNLYGARITPSIGHRLFLQQALKVKMVANAAMRSAALNRFLLAAPTFPEIGTLFQLVSILRKKRFDHIVIDLPATGHAMGLASLPKTVLKIVPKGLIGDAIQEGLDAMTDPARGCAVLVTLPESMPITESLELSEGLAKLTIPVRAMILNRMPADPFSEAQRTAINQHIQARDDLLLGTREFRRLERALAARAMFQDQVPSHLYKAEVPLFEERQTDQVIERMETAIAAMDVSSGASS